MAAVLPTADLRVTSTDFVPGGSVTYTVIAEGRRPGIGRVTTSMQTDAVPGTTVVNTDIDDPAGTARTDRATDRAGTARGLRVTDPEIPGGQPPPDGALGFSQRNSGVASVVLVAATLGFEDHQRRRRPVPAGTSCPAAGSRGCGRPT